MKKAAVMLLTAAMVTMMFTGCGNSEPKTADNFSSGTTEGGRDKGSRRKFKRNNYSGRLVGVKASRGRRSRRIFGKISRCSDYD